MTTVTRWGLSNSIQIGKSVVAAAAEFTGGSAPTLRGPATNRMKVTSHTNEATQRNDFIGQLFTSDTAGGEYL